MTLAERFIQFKAEFCKFRLVENKLASRGDLHGMILLNQLCPAYGDIIEAAEHDRIWFNVDVDKLNMVASDEQVKDLIRCGVMYDTELDSLAMYV